MGFHARSFARTLVESTEVVKSGHNPAAVGGSHRSWDSRGLPSMKLKALILAVLALPLDTLQYQHH